MGWLLESSLKNNNSVSLNTSGPYLTTLNHNTSLQIIKVTFFQTSSAPPADVSPFFDSR